MNRFGFGPASEDETIVFGAQRPGLGRHHVSQEELTEWIDFMKGQGIRRVCCLLPPIQLAYYDGLFETYRRKFGDDNLCPAEVEDYHLCEPEVLRETILPFLRESVDTNQPVVVHCSGGSGRTGHVLATWLVAGRGRSVGEAIDTVKRMDRNPYEAIECGNATRQQLLDLLKGCSQDAFE